MTQSYGATATTRSLRPPGRQAQLGGLFAFGGFVSDQIELPKEGDEEVKPVEIDPQELEDLRARASTAETRLQAAESDKVRPESLKVFIAVTDDDPISFSAATLGCSNCAMHQCPTFADSPADWGGADFPTELYNLPGGVFGTQDAPRWIFHAIIGVQQQYTPADPVTGLNQTCAYGGNTAETSGVEYQKLARLTGGIRFPSCDTDYSPVFNEIASTIVPMACEFLIESTNLGTIDPGETNVEWDPMDGTGSSTILMDDSAPCDSGAEGWQWNEDFTRIRLCGGICDTVQNNPNGRITIVVGCQTLVAQ